MFSTFDDEREKRRNREPSYSVDTIGTEVRASALLRGGTVLQVSRDLQDIPVPPRTGKYCQDSQHERELVAVLECSSELLSTLRHAVRAYLNGNKVPDQVRVSTGFSLKRAHGVVERSSTRAQSKIPPGFTKSRKVRESGTWREDPTVQESIQAYLLALSEWKAQRASILRAAMEGKITRPIPEPPKIPGAVRKFRPELAGPEPCAPKSEPQSKAKYLATARARLPRR